MTTQEIIFKMLAVEGDCWHELGLRVTEYSFCINCQETYAYLIKQNLKKGILNVNPDLTTEAGAFWLLKRLPAWDRFDEFNIYLSKRMSLDMDEWDSHVVIDGTLIWITTDAKDGKAPALFNALCEFTGLEK